jgi:hypothetical protein
MPGDLVGKIGLLQARDFLGAEFHADRRHGIVEMVRLGSPHNRRHQAGLVQQPRQRDLRRRNSPLAADLFHPVHDALVRFRRFLAVKLGAKSSVRARVVFALRLPARTPRASGLHGIRPTPSATQSGFISRSSSR